MPYLLAKVIEGPREGGACRYHCDGCGQETGWIRMPVPIHYCDAKAPPPTESGPGTELHAMLSQLGFKIGGSGCGGGCVEWIQKMDAWGPPGCREHRDEIIRHLESQRDAASLTAKLAAGALAIRHGLPMTIAGLVDEAIDRAEISATAR